MEETTSKFNLLLRKLFESSLHSIGEGGVLTQGHGDDQAHNTWHGTDAINSNLLVTYPHIPEEENTARHPGTHSACAWEPSEPPGDCGR